MGLRINTNVPALSAVRNLGITNAKLGQSLERLSSGMKINSAGDDPAGLVISKYQEAQLTGLNQAVENSERATTLVATAEGALSEVNRLLNRARELALDAANTGTNDSESLAASQSELDNILASISRISNNTQFGTRKLLNGAAGVTGTPSATAVTFVSGTSDTVSGTYALIVTTPAEKARVISAAQTAALAANETLTLNGISITLASGTTQDNVVARINEFSTQTGVTAYDSLTTTMLLSTSFGSGASISVQSNVAGATNSSNFGTTKTTDAGVDVAATIDGSVGTGIGASITAITGSSKGISVTFAATSVGNGGSGLSVTGAQGNVVAVQNGLQFQVGSNSGQTVTLSIQDMSSDVLAVGVSNQSSFASLNAVKITTAQNASDALTLIDDAIGTISSMRGSLGAFQTTTLESTINALSINAQNLSAAMSMVVDVDFASEVAEFTKAQILQQSGVSVLSNANVTPQTALALLG